MGYITKTEAELRWDEMKKRLRLEGQLVLYRVLNETFDEANAEFLASQKATGQLMDIPETRAELQAYFVRATQRVVANLLGGQRALASKQ